MGVLSSSSLTQHRLNVGTEIKTYFRYKNSTMTSEESTKNINLPNVMEPEPEKYDLIVSGSPESNDSLFGDDGFLCDEETIPEPPSEVPLSFSQLLNPGLSRRPHSSIGFAASLGLDELAIPPKSPHSNTRKRNFSTNAAISTILTIRMPLTLNFSLRHYNA